MVQKFIDGDQEENKFFNVFNKVINTTFEDFKKYYTNAYSSPELGLALYELQRVPIYKVLEKSLFIRAYSKILEGEAYIGTIEGYLTILRAIFGETADIKLDIVDPLHLRFNINAEVQKFYLWITKKGKQVITKDGRAIVFKRILAEVTARQLLEILKATTNAGTYVEFILNEEEI